MRNPLKILKNLCKQSRERAEVAQSSLKMALIISVFWQGNTTKCTSPTNHEKFNKLRTRDTDTVTFYGPEDILKLNPSKLNVIFEIGSDKLSSLTTRQKDILKYLLDHARIASEGCTKTFNITRDTANRDFKRLMELELIEQKGSGRATHYVLKEQKTFVRFTSDFPDVSSDKKRFF